MSAPPSRWRRALPDLPRRRYNSFTATNTWAEWRGALADLVSPGRVPEDVARYEEAFASTVGCRHGIAFGAGRMALWALLGALDLEPGDEVLLPGFTCAVVCNAVLYRGLRPVYADIDPVTFNVDPASVEARLTDRTRALYLQHTFGITAPVERLREIAARHGLVLVEDAAHSLGASHRGVPHGALGDVAFFSTDRTKVVNTHSGGVVTTNDDRLAARLRAIQEQTPALPAGTRRRQLAAFLAEHLLYAPGLLWLGRPAVAALKRTGLLHYWTDELLTSLPPGYGYPCQLSPAQARLGLSQLEQLPANLAHRRAVAHWLESRVGWYGEAVAEPGTQTWLRYAFLLDDRAGLERRFAGRMELMTWFTSVIYCRDHDLLAVGYEEGSCPVAEAVARHMVNIPTAPRWPLDAIARIWERHEEWILDHVVRPDALPVARADPHGAHRTAAADPAAAARAEPVPPAAPPAGTSGGPGDADRSTRRGPRRRTP